VLTYYQAQAHSIGMTLLHLNYKRRSVALCVLDSVTTSAGPSATAVMPLPGLEHTVRTNKMHPATQSNIPE